MLVFRSTDNTLNTKCKKFQFYTKKQFWTQRDDDFDILIKHFEENSRIDQAHTSYLLLPKTELF